MTRPPTSAKVASRRRFLHLVGLGAAGALLTACTPTPPGPTAAKATTPSSDSAAGSAGDLSSIWGGKTVTLSVGSPAGGSYDAWARLVARHLGRHLPGGPSVIIENVPGGEHRVAANRLVEARPNGLSILLASRAIPDFQLRGEGPDKGVRYDVSRMGWLGSSTTETQVLVVHGRAGIADLKQLETTPLRLGHQTVGGPPHVFDVVLREGLGWARGPRAFGWEGVPDILLAIDRGDIDAAIFSWPTLVRPKRGELEQGLWRPLVQMGAGTLQDPLVAHVPTADNLFKDKSAESRQMLQMAQRPFVYSRPFVAPPGLEPRVLAAMRAAFMATMADPALHAEATQLDLEVDPLPGERVEELIAEQLRTPPAVVERLNALIEADTPR